MTIQELVQIYDNNRASYLTSTYNEMQLRSDFLDPLFELLGWDIKNTLGKPTNKREVLLEEALRTDAMDNCKKPDYTFRLYSERKFFVEAKKPDIQIESNIKCAQQIRRYGFTARLKVSVLTNFEYLLIYDCSLKVEEGDSHDKGLIKKYHYTEYKDKYEEINGLLGRESVYSGKFDEAWEYIEKKLSFFSIDYLFLEQINGWRLQLGNEIFKHKPDIKEEELNDCVQSYINRIIFLRVCEDRNLEIYQTLLRFANEQDFMALIAKFKQADRKYNSGLFNQILSDKIIGEIRSEFWLIIKQLYYPESVYSFAVFTSDLLGRIYEIFLSEKLIVQDGKIVLVNKPEQIDRDIITTPSFIINAILHRTIEPFLSTKSDNAILESKIADISCGSGAFLIELFQLLNDTLIDFYLQHDKFQLVHIGVNTFKLPFETKKKLLINCIYGVDKDYNAVEATKFGLLLKLLEGEDSSSVTPESAILPDLSNNIEYGNSLLSPQDVRSKKESGIINVYDFGSKHYDVIIGNPPYLKSEDMAKITPLEFNKYKKKYVTAYRQFDKYFLFIERALELLKAEGWLGYIVPSKFIKVGAGVKLREYLQREGYLHTIESFGAYQIFESKTTYTCLLVLRKKKQTNFYYNEVGSIDKWKAAGRDDSEYQKIDISLINKDVWVLVPARLQAIYEKINSQSVILEELTGKEGIFNGIQTSANSVYIFEPINEDESYYYFKKKGDNWKIEKSFTKPYFRTTFGKDSLSTYRPFKPNSRVIYPYKHLSSGMRLISLMEIKQKYPFAYKYLNSNIKVLNNPQRSIIPKPRSGDEWHRYGRHQSLDRCGLPEKIIVGVLSVGNKYAIDLHGTLVSSGGTAGYCVISLPKDSQYSIYYIQALLSSKYLEWYSSLLGEVYRGGYIARGTKVIKRLPIRKIDFNDVKEKGFHDKITRLQKKLIKKQGEIDFNDNNQRNLIKLKREFNILKSQSDLLMKKLYGLEEDDSLIPSIRELYEAD